MSCLIADIIERKDGKSACQKEASEWRSRCSFPLSSSYVWMWNLHSIREHSSWYKRCWLLILRTVPSWYSASLHRAAKLKIPHILPSVYLSVMKRWGYFSVQSSRGGRGWWWEVPRPATSACCLVELAWADECEELRGPSSQTKALQEASHWLVSLSCAVLACTHRSMSLN